MRVYDYKDYDEYVSEQTSANKRKLGWKFKKEDHIQWIKRKKLSANNIVCHGTRNGGEQKVFQKYYPDAYIIGTEISETATQFDMTVQHDFSEPKNEWISKFDIVYSNSFDHSLDPSKTIETWKKQLSYDGRIFVEWSDFYNAESTSTDPVSGTTKDFINFLKSHNIIVEDTLNGPGLFMCKTND